MTTFRDPSLNHSAPSSPEASSVAGPVAPVACRACARMVEAGDFCSECGAGLPAPATMAMADPSEASTTTVPGAAALVACPACARTVEAGTFCSECGGSLSPPPPPPPSAPPRAPAPTVSAVPRAGTRFTAAYGFAAVTDGSSADQVLIPRVSGGGVAFLEREGTVRRFLARGLVVSRDGHPGDLPARGAMDLYVSRGRVVLVAARPPRGRGTHLVGQVQSAWLAGVGVRRASALHRPAVRLVVVDARDGASVSVDVVLSRREDPPEVLRAIAVAAAEERLERLSPHAPDAQSLRSLPPLTAAPAGAFAMLTLPGSEPVAPGTATLVDGPREQLATAAPRPASLPRRRPLLLAGVIAVAAAGATGGALAATGTLDSSSPPVSRAADDYSAGKTKPRARAIRSVSTSGPTDAGGAAAGGGGSSSAPSSSPPASGSGSGSGSGSAPSASSTARRPPRPRTAAASAPAVGPAAIVRRHLELLSAGDYQRAFVLMSPAYRASSPNWPAARAAAAAKISIVKVGSPVRQGAAADVPVGFFARDRRDSPGSDTSCRHFAGTAHLILVGGSWHYDPERNNIQKSRRPSSDPRCP